MNGFVFSSPRLSGWFYGCLAAVIFCVTGCGDQGLDKQDPTPPGWYRWRGPNQNGHVTGRDLLRSWPLGGPEVLWRKPIGEGYSTILASGNRVYACYNLSDGEYLFCLNREDGAEIWRARLNEVFEEEYGNGPRSTPVLDNGRIYAMGSLAVLHALDATTGKALWRHDLFQQFGDPGKGYGRGYTSSPFIEGQRLFIHVGSTNAVVCLDKRSGRQLWSTGQARTYSSPLMMSFGESRHLVSFLGNGLLGSDPSNGDQLWFFNWGTRLDLNVATPLFVGPNRVMISAGNDKGATMLEISGSGKRWSVRELWTNRFFRNHFNDSVMIHDAVYGFDNSDLKCIDLATGQDRWKTKGFGKGTLIGVEDMLLVLGERGNLALLEATPDAYRELAQFQVLKGKCWTSPVYTDGILYLRNHEEMVALRLVAR